MFHCFSQNGNCDLLIWKRQQVQKQQGEEKELLLAKQNNEDGQLVFVCKETTAELSQSCDETS